MRRLRVLSLLLVLLLAGCAGFTHSLIVTGTTVAEAGDEFAAVSKMYVAGCASPPAVLPRIPLEQCPKFYDFGVRWQQIYPLAGGLWQAARAAGDRAAAERAEAVILGLMVDLSALAAQALETFGGGQ